MKLLNMKTAKSLQTVSELQDFIEGHKSNNTVGKSISFRHKNTEALWYNDELDKRTETTVSKIDLVTVFGRHFVG